VSFSRPKQEPSKESLATKVLDKTELQAQFGRAMGRIVNGVYVITLQRSDHRDGMLSTWLSQVSFDPPLISIGIKEGRPILSALSEAAPFVVNVLSKGNMHVFKNFAKPDLPGEARFEGLEYKVDHEFGPVLSTAVSYLFCRVKKHIPVGDHVLVIAEVVGGAMLNEGDEPMVHLRKSGFQY